MRKRTTTATKLVGLSIATTMALAGIESVTLGEPPEAARNGVDLERDLLAHWPLAGDANDRSPNKHHAQLRGHVDWQVAGPRGMTAAGFNGRDSVLEVPGAPRLGSGDFTLAAWIHTAADMDDLPGDIVSQYDPGRRRGFHLSLKTNAGVTTTQANYRHLQFGIDNDRASKWVDCGRPGNALLAFALAAHDSQLWAGTCEPGKDEAGHVYHYGGGGRWIDHGSPAPCNSVTALAAFDGKLYAGTGKYRLRGSALAESENGHLGGRVYRYDDGSWTDCGGLEGVESVGGMVVFRGRLYASSMYQPAGFFRYEGGSNWTACPTPGKRVEALGVFDGFLYATCYDGGHVYRFDGSEWTDCGQLGEAADNTQTYSFAVYGGRLHVGTWRSGRVYRFEDVNRWTDVGRLGEELEVMGMLVHNGRLMAGTLPLAEVYSYEGDAGWRRLARLDHTPQVRYRRAWTMAEHGGVLYCSTLPSGHIFAFEAGSNISWDRQFPPGWHHVAAVKDDGQLHLYVDGRLTSPGRGRFDPAQYDLASDAPLRIGLGANDYFCGRLSGVRLYGRALNATQISRLADAP
ncbi:MAG: LamG domain-containing protein [Pirellulales bacterium]